MSYTEQFAEVHYPLAFEPADSIAASTVTGTFVSMANYHRAVLHFNIGDMATGSTVDVSIVQAQDVGGTNVKAITGKAATQLTQAGGDGGQVLAIELRTEELDIANGFDFIAYKIVVAVDASELACTLFGLEPRFAPVPTTNWTEIVD